MEKQVNIGGKEYTIRELSYIESISLSDMSKTDMAKYMLKKTANLSDEEIEKLSLKDGMELQKYINELNGFTDFQSPVKTE